jgi:hypothetical protein
VDTVSIDDFFADLDNGNGNELENKFKALYSSSALGVNFFGFFKKNRTKFSIFGEKDFNCAQFEKKLPTGLNGTAPNLDFYLENDNFIIGFESKFLEILTPKQPKFSASYSDSFLSTIESGLPKILNHYRANNTKTYLDTAQLIKHSIGLLNNKGNKKAKLIYIYWEPLNAKDFPEYKQHKEELDNFEKQITTLKDITFQHISYFELYNNFANDKFFEQHLSNFKDKYIIKIT